MLSEDSKKQYYQALLEKDSGYEGVFFVGVTTTGVFCRPSCPARKPKFHHCEFFKTAQEALLASYRPCKRCKPLSYPKQQSSEIQKLVDAVEKNPEKRWKDSDFNDLGLHPVTARRQFQKRFGMTFFCVCSRKKAGPCYETNQKRRPCD